MLLRDARSRLDRSESKRGKEPKELDDSSKGFVSGRSKRRPGKVARYLEIDTEHDKCQ